MTDDIHAVRKDLELMKLQLSHNESVLSRMDFALEKITEFSNSVNKLLAVHVNKIEQQDIRREEMYQDLKEQKKRIDDVNEKVDDNQREIVSSINNMKNEFNKSLSRFEKIIWLVTGGAIVLGGVLSLILQIGSIFIK